MKRIFLVAAALVLFASSAIAGPLVAPHKVSKSVWFRTHIAAPTDAQKVLPNSGYDAMGFYVDSLSATKAAAATFDTTAGISTDGWWVPPSTGLADSAYNAVTLLVYDLGGSGATADSMWIDAQVSADGKSWQPVAACLGAPTHNAFLANTTVNGTVRLYLPIGGTASSSNAWMSNYKRSTQFVAGANPTVFNFTDWPLIRFILKGTDTIKTNIGAKVIYYSSDEDLNR